MSFDNRSIFEEEHTVFRDNFRRFCEEEVKPHQEKWIEQGIVDREIWEKAGESGFLAPAVDEEYGGLSLDDFRYSQIMIEELARIGENGFALSLHNDVIAPYISAYGSEEQKQRWLPGICSGETILAIAMTEPDTGSDLQAIKSRLEDNGDHYILNGSKTYISNGIISDLVIVAAKAPEGVTLVAVPRGAEGFNRGRNLKKMGMKSQDTAELFFENVVVPKTDVLGQPGQGFIYLMQKLAQERLVTAVGAIGGSVFAFNETLNYVKERTAFGKPIGKFQNTRFRMAELKTEITIGQTFVDSLVIKLNAGTITPDEASMAKWWCTDLLNRVVDQGVQFHGGAGYMMEYPIARAYVDARITPIFAGTNEIMKEIIGRSLGL
ncbi:MAG: acyl-CoA dehydrogenase [Pseudomonadales bacterium]|mgnify:FL=1|jgi:alkylation response protein AidB-like acyl-CoA dehydrogenase|uniref:acyl-CoA dehydrogenase family protein n=1 Tax=unclassified Ketobacter TaxID=2639109 RepID=UPI000C419859|nr:MULTISPECIES: acyl-CoA dehydrogenase family protein [unclassified Ketobacter]MAA59108.1 acyl-CoA dehydrogenase [Pseudomonadales bacterium]MEC8810637.1 acyl-CoA dehydrogenase family protein [Pseudomonadota bacterium]HAG96639.1 acyl-CoA dehydrogenase [Gammaproteobacteria bacterium]MAQ24900.1 acyl-CoA dehydrogenase [Pseudomonadales bacterium]MBI26750.1 acyl-CoA dehydrogenase [Pseudomonadales bacterium]|tara:strand:- start:31102 stop:32238 length:1137 start_codon:yes stop_codon:yes gene_type:complete